MDCYRSLICHPVSQRSGIKDPEFQVDLKAKPLEGEPEGRSSRFVGTHDGLGNVKEFQGTISGEVDGTPYFGKFQEEPHTHD